MYLIEPWMFSVHDTSHVTLLSWRTSFHFLPEGGSGCLESLWGEYLTFKSLCSLNIHSSELTKQTVAHLLQLTMMSWGLMRRLSMPIFGWSPRPRNRPGGSMRKLAIRSLWLSMMQKPYSWRRRSFSNFNFYKGRKTKHQNLSLMGSTLCRDRKT